ncbi:MAG: class D beta-lactamase [Ignavibacteria bacterium]|nr:class D beta-lactamase [Ignavibacteria bacterium]
MKILLLILCFFLISSCNSKDNSQKIPGNSSDKKTESVPSMNTGSKEEYREDFQQILDSSDLAGSILIYDPQSEIFYSNNFQRADSGFLPASTFKIVNSVIAIEAGMVESDSTVFKWNGVKRMLPEWEQDMILKDAFHYSCVPCYQEIAVKIGPERMARYLKAFEYGNMIMDSSNIDEFWLRGDSKISQRGQINFLKKFYNSQLPVSVRTFNILKRMMVINDNDEFILSGKTGWSFRDGNDNGWFVGYIETGGKVFFFAANVEPKENFNMDNFAHIRKQITLEALKKLDVIKDF